MKRELLADVDNDFYESLISLQFSYPKQYEMSGLCEVISNPNRIPRYSIKMPSFNINDKKDDGNANTRDRYMGILLKEFTNPIEKTENYRILYHNLYSLYGRKLADEFLLDDVKGIIYTHNSQNIATKPYCFAYDFDILAEKGAFFTDISDRPAKHLDSFIQHVIEFVAVTCRESTGAVGMPALFPYLWYFWNNDILSGYISEDKKYKYLEQQIQMLVYKLNGSEMRMNESAFTNVSCMDESYLETFFGDRCFPNGEPVINHIDEIVEFELFFLECVNDILSHKVMTFPVITDCMLYDEKAGKFVNEKTARKFSDLNTKWNNANMYCGTDISTLSSCCRVLNNVDTINNKLKGFSNFIGGSDLNIGSVGVITINLPHWAQSMKEGDVPNVESALLYLEEEILNVCKYLEGVRSCIKGLISKRALKLYDLDLAKIERQFNTVGFIGLYDAAMIFKNRDPYFMSYCYENTNDILSRDPVLRFEKAVLELFAKVTSEFCSNKPYSINVEQIPGESACVKLAQKDFHTFGYYIQGTKCYSNQWIPLSEYRSIIDRADYASVLDKLCGGGSILHINLDSPITKPQTAWNLLNAIAKKGVIYFAFNNRISVDEHEHGFYGDTCWCGAPKVGEATRPVGFITLVKNWIPSRKEEYEERKWNKKSTSTAFK